MTVGRVIKLFKIVENTYFGVNDLEQILNEAKENGTQTNNQKIVYHDIICAFDIETTSLTDKTSATDKNEKRAIMYIWQLAINGRVIIGREWSEFLYAIDYITRSLCLDLEHRLLVFVHNLSYEFQFIRKFFHWEKVFAIDTRKPIYAITDFGLEFRCSYILTNYSLAKLGEQLQKYKVSKMVNDLDYKVMRNPLTKLSRKELNYCINDCLVVSAYIKECEEQKNIYIGFHTRLLHIVGGL